MRKVPELRAGDLIRESWLRDLVRQVNRNTRMLSTIQDQYTAGDANLGQRPWSPAAGVAPDPMPTSLTWTEVSATRTSASKTITDSNSDTHTIDQATKIRMTASSGGTSYSWTFHFSTS